MMTCLRNIAKELRPLANVIFKQCMLACFVQVAREKHTCPAIIDSQQQTDTICILTLSGGKPSQCWYSANVKLDGAENANLRLSVVIGSKTG